MRTPIHVCVADADAAIAEPLVDRLRRPVTGLIIEPPVRRGHFHAPGAEAVREALAQRIGETLAVACIIGPAARSDPWVEWELEAALERRIGIVAIRIRPGSHDFPPRAALHAGAPLVDSHPGSVVAALERIAFITRTGAGNK